MSVIARSPSTPLRFAQDRLRDEAISEENEDCFAPLAMTFQLHFTALPFRREGYSLPMPLVN